MIDMSRDTVSIFTGKMSALAKEMEATGYGHSDGSVVALLRAAARDLDEQNQARGGVTGVSIVRPEALQAFAAISPARHTSLLKEQVRKTTSLAVSAGSYGASDPLLRRLSGDSRGTFISAAADEHASKMTAAASAETERHRPAAEALLARGGVQMPAFGLKLEAAAVDEVLTKARIVQTAERFAAKRTLERAGVY